MASIQGLKRWARHLKQETFALYLAARHPETPWYAKLLVAAIVAYALSPIDLIPDFVPVLGYLDDLLLIPAGIALALQLIPASIMAECRAKAQANVRASRAAAGVIIVIWLVLAALAAAWLYRAFIS